MLSPASPPVHERYERDILDKNMHIHLVGRYPGWRNCSHRLPKRVFKTLSDS